MGLKERLHDFIGIGPINPNLEACANEFLAGGKPGTRIVDFYTSTVRLRDISKLMINGRYFERSWIATIQPDNNTVLVKPEGAFISDGK